MIKMNAIKYSILIICTLTVSACSSFGYYMDLMAGHSELLEQRQPIAEILEEKQTNQELRQMLDKSLKMRDFATKSLYLPENDSYRHYADIKRKYAVWNVVAAQEFSLEAKKWCFLIVGCLSYRGYFSKDDAKAYAAQLKKEGYDVHVAGATAYSTLGWFDDPLLNTMMYKSEARRAGVIFHELAHQLIYIDDDTAFNEAFATVVEQEGVRRWMEAAGQKEKFDEYLLDKKRDADINNLLLETRKKLKILYEMNSPDERRRIAKKNIFENMQVNYKRLKKTWHGAGVNDYDQWMSQGLDNSHLSLIATYHHLVPGFQAMMKDENYDLANFYSLVQKIGKYNKAKRAQIFNQQKLVKN